ncbi:Hypp7288 [Branchiostoma lanceolatum]|uniref:Hypp7288 protein n=1 Tax=Branchiostoma lanceolatum TaxID=7740 RepID=A0A8J9YZD3_BRALA|nr:Hypp7288 [Branchiostoma lanceolatum]
MLVGRAYYLLSDVYQKDKKYGLAEKYMDLAKQVLSNFEIGEDTGETYYNKASLYAAIIANHSSPPSRLFDERHQRHQFEEDVLVLVGMLAASCWMTLTLEVRLDNSGPPGAALVRLLKTAAIGDLSL